MLGWYLVVSGLLMFLAALDYADYSAYLGYMIESSHVPCRVLGFELDDREALRGVFYAVLERIRRLQSVNKAAC